MGVRDATVAVEEQNGFVYNCNWDYHEVKYIHTFVFTLLLRKIRVINRCYLNHYKNRKRHHVNQSQPHASHPNRLLVPSDTSSHKRGVSEDMRRGTTKLATCCFLLLCDG